MLLGSFDVMAQVGQPWLIGGNNLSANRSFGANNNWDIFFETNNVARGRLTRDGNWGFGPGTPSPYRAKVSHAGFGFDIEQTSTGDDWEFFISSGFLQLFFNGTGNFRGEFNPTTGAYSSVSDERLKTNIKPMTTVLEKINRL